MTWLQMRVSGSIKGEIGSIIVTYASLDLGQRSDSVLTAAAAVKRLPVSVSGSVSGFG